MHLAIYFPGGALRGQDPFDERLAWVTIRALEDAGAVVVRHARGLADDGQRGGAVRTPRLTSSPAQYARL